MALVRIICDGGGSYGFGNLRRSATLATEFQGQGWRVQVEVLSALGRALLPACPQDVGNPDVVLLDLPYNGGQMVGEGRQRGCPVAALDYTGTSPPDLVISVFDRGTSPREARNVAGLEYAIIRQELRDLAPAPEGHGVLVAIGGGDQQGLGEAAAERLYDEGCDVTLIEGPLAVSSRELPSAIKRLVMPPDLAARMASCSWAVTSGGGTMLECLCLGKAVHALPRTQPERALAEQILARDGLLGMGLESLSVPADRERRRTAMIGPRLVDGRGAERIVKIVGSLL